MSDPTALGILGGCVVVLQQFVLMYLLDRLDDITHERDRLLEDRAVSPR